MSPQNSIVVTAEDNQVLRPVTDQNWQLFRDTADPGEGSYHAINKDGIKENIAGAVSDGITVDILNNGANAFTSVVSANAVPPISYQWDAANSLGFPLGTFFEINNGATVLRPLVDILLNTPPDQSTAQYSITPDAVNSGLVKLTVTDANGKVARDYRLVFMIPEP